MNKTIKEMAKELNCSYEAIRQQTKRYNKELKGHIFQDGKLQLLDEFACDFLRQKRQYNSHHIQIVERDEAYDELNKKYIKLLEENKKLLEVNHQLELNEHQRLLLINDKNKEIEVQKSEKADLRASYDKTVKLLAEAEKTVQSLSDELVTANTRALSLKEFFKRRFNK